MDIKLFEVGPFMENTYLLSTGEGSILIDPGFAQESEYQEFKSYLENTLTAIVLTHAHVDHVLGLSRVLRDFEVPVYLNKEDTFLWDNYGSQVKMFGLNDTGFDFEPDLLPSEGNFQVGEFEFECRYTPGHSPDHTSLYFKDEKAVIAGDALFRESIGRTDLYKGDFELLAQSIREQLYSLPDDTTVYPGHGPSTTVGHEKQFNPFVKN